MALDDCTSKMQLYYLLNLYQMWKNLNIQLFNTKLDDAEYIAFLGLRFDSRLRFNDQIEHIMGKW